MKQPNTSYTSVAVLLCTMLGSGERHRAKNGRVDAVQQGAVFLCNVVPFMGNLRPSGNMKRIKFLGKLFTVTLLSDPKCFRFDQLGSTMSCDMRP